MNRVENEELAILLRVSDASLHPYLQRYPFLTGPDERQNRICYSAVRDSVTLRPGGKKTEIEELAPGELWAETNIRDTARSILKSIGYPNLAATKSLECRAWKMCLVPADSKKVLALGCGEGEELATLRSRLPHARICGSDWVNKVSPRLLERTNANFQVGNFNQLLQSQRSEFDLIFSNHVIEHSFDPDRLLRAINQALSIGGCLVSALPLDSESQTPYFRSLLALARRPNRIKRCDMFWLATGHPYKTNATELASALRDAGFKSVRIAYRPWCSTTFPVMHANGIEALRARNAVVHAWTMGLVHKSVNGIFGCHPPLPILRAIGFAESRLSFGIVQSLRMAREAIVVAHK